MGTRRLETRLLVGLVVVLVSLFLAGCQMGAVRSERAHDDWSRGAHLGKTAINGRVGFAGDLSGQNLYAVWVTKLDPGGAQGLHFSHLDRAGRILDERDLGIVANRPSHVEIVLDDDGRLHVAWIDRVDGVRQLLYALLDDSGGLLSDRQVLSSPQVSVDSYAMGLAPFGGLDVFWATRRGEKAGLYHMHRGMNGEKISEDVLLREGGFDPAFRIDRQGLFHLAWHEEPDYGRYSLYYATFDGESRQLGSATKLAERPTSTGVIAHRPVMGLAGNDVYLFFSTERRGGGISGPSAWTSCLAFPLGRPELAGQPQEIRIPDLNHPHYQEGKSAFNLQELANPLQGYLTSEFVYLAATIDGHHDELPVAFSVRISGRTKDINQIVLTLWADGEIKGYQITAKTSSGSLRPMILADAGEDLHLSWIDTGGFGTYDTFYASTSKEARAYLNRLTGQDILAAGFNVIWGLVQATGFMLVGLIWGFLPLVLLGAYAVVRADDDLAHKGARIVLGLAILLYAMCKYLFKPGWLAALRLPHQWPADLANVIMLTLPLLISLVAWIIAWALSKRRQYNSLFFVFGVFAVTDVLLTLLIYVPSLLAE